MNKIGAIAITVGMVIICYFIMLVVMPVIADLVATANTTMATSSNMSDYPGTAGFLVSTPWILWFIPASLGIVVVVMILRMP